MVKHFSSFSGMPCVLSLIKILLYYFLVWSVVEIGPLNISPFHSKFGGVVSMSNSRLLFFCKNVNDNSRTGHYLLL